MPKPSYISLEIDGVVADIDPKGQIPTVSYQLEDENDFEQKKSAESLNIEMPGTLINDQIHNTLHNPSVIDSTPQGTNDNFKPLRYIANGQEILIGKYLPQSVTKKDGRPEKYKGKAYGLNGDWVIDLKEKTLMDFVNPRTHNFDIPAITGSWTFDGTSEAMDYIYAPARYRKKFHLDIDPTIEPPPAQDPDNVLINDLKPAISIYWLLWRGFKSLGYRIVSTFMDLDYYRRSVLPWTWGGFDYIDDTRWEGLKFLAGQPGELQGMLYYDPGPGNSTAGNDHYPDLSITDDNSIVPGAFDNSNLFSYSPASGTYPHMMVWQYPATAPLSLGNIQVGLSIQFQYGYVISNNGDVLLKIEWYKNGTLMQSDEILNVSPGLIETRSGQDFTEVFFVADIVPGDWIGCRVYEHIFHTTLSAYSNEGIRVKVEAFQLNYVRLGPGSTVDFANNYPKFKNYKWLDLLRGEIDTFDLSIQTDPIRKEVYIEPTHAYEINGTIYPGYYNRRQLEWSQKVDISKESELELFSDYERELIFKFQDDTNDGGLKKIQDRNQTIIGMAKYVLPGRFKSEVKEKENRFYSPVMHRDYQNFKYITGIAPQLITIVPENISNTSNDASENVYNPKRAWYKGIVSGVGGWKFEGITYENIPFMFAVNYKPGGETDPVLSYADQLIGGVIAKGLMKKFFLQRLAIFRHGRRYSPIYVMLNNYDITNFLHRESIIIENIEYLLTGIREYDPIDPESTACNMWMFIPMSERDRDNSYPSIASIQTGVNNPMDVKYWPHVLLTSDVVE